MIKNKKDYLEFLIQDKIALGRKTKKPKWNDYIWKYEILLRKCEYLKNTGGGYTNKFLFKIFNFKRNCLGLKLGFSIPLNVFDSGLSIAHIGPIIVNGGSKIGKNCRIHVGVNIGTQAGKQCDAPILGNNIYIGPGAKLFGKIIIADDIAIGANAVVNKSFEESGISIAGVPAKKISNKGTKGIKE